WLDEYLLSKTGVSKDFKVEWQWHRYLIKEKMFGAICADKVGKPIVTVKCEPMVGELLRSQYTDIVPGYYMSKEHWNSVYLEGEVPDEVLKKMIDMSYTLVFNSFSKKLQIEILGEIK
ncbi:MAG: MmcQ/YjbR family DNA-binding protein, partial [Ruminiclostridium sp.]